MLAWIRTATSLITFGFGVSKLSNLVWPGSENQGYIIGPNTFGLILVCIGLVSLLLAVVEHRQGIRELGAQYEGKSRSLAVLVAGLIGVLGVVALLAMIGRP